MLNRQGSPLLALDILLIPQSAQNFTALGAFSSEQEAALGLLPSSAAPVQLDARRIRQGYNHFEVRQRPAV